MDINELTYQIRGAVFEVSRILGSGFLEKVYEKALLIEPRFRIQNEKVNYVKQLPIKILRLHVSFKPYYYCDKATWVILILSKSFFVSGGSLTAFLILWPVLLSSRVAISISLNGA